MVKNRFVWDSKEIIFLRNSKSSFQSIINLSKHKIGKGSGRTAYIIGGRSITKFVVKKARNEGGVLQNRKEIELSDKGNCELVPKVFYHSPDYKTIVVPYIKMVESDNQFKKLAGLSFKKIMKIMNYDKPSSNKIIKGLRYLIKTEKLWPGDLLSLKKWGVLDGKLIIRDVGMTTEHMIIMRKAQGRELYYPDVPLYKDMKLKKSEEIKIGEGTGRAVYRDMTNPKYVVKRAININGIRQNKVEVDLFNKTQSWLMPAFIHNEDLTAIVCEYVEPLKSIEEFEKLAGMPFVEFADIIARGKESDNGVVAELRHLMKVGGLGFSDLLWINAWGTINRQLKVKDLGLSNKAYTEMVKDWGLPSKEK